MEHFSLPPSGISALVLALRLQRPCQFLQPRFQLSQNKVPTNSLTNHQLLLPTYHRNPEKENPPVTLTEGFVIPFQYLWHLAREGLEPLSHWADFIRPDFRVGLLRCCMPYHAHRLPSSLLLYTQIHFIAHPHYTRWPRILATIISSFFLWPRYHVNPALRLLVRINPPAPPHLAFPDLLLLHRLL